MAAKKRRMAKTMIAIWGNGARHEWVSVSRAEGWWGRVPVDYLQGRHVVGQADGDGGLHVQDVVVPEEIP